MEKIFREFLLIKVFRWKKKDLWNRFKGIDMNKMEKICEVDFGLIKEIKEI